MPQSGKGAVSMRDSYKEYLVASEADMLREAQYWRLLPPGPPSLVSRARALAAEAAAVRAERWARAVRRLRMDAEPRVGASGYVPGAAAQVHMYLKAVTAVGSATDVAPTAPGPAQDWWEALTAVDAEASAGSGADMGAGRGGGGRGLGGGGCGYWRGSRQRCEFRPPL